MVLAIVSVVDQKYTEEWVNGGHQRKGAGRRKEGVVYGKAITIRTVSVLWSNGAM